MTSGWLTFEPRHVPEHCPICVSREDDPVVGSAVTAIEHIRAIKDGVDAAEDAANERKRR